MARESKTESPSLPGKGSKPPEARPFKYRLLGLLPPDRKTVGIQLLILMGVGLVASWLLAPDFLSAVQLYDFDESSIGKISQRVIKANRDYEITIPIPKETMERLRKEARETVLPVYNEDLSIPQAALDRVSRAFALMRDSMAKVDAQLAQAEAARQRLSESALTAAKAVAEAPSDKAAGVETQEAQAPREALPPELNDELPEAAERQATSAAVQTPLPTENAGGVAPPPAERERLYREAFFSKRDEWQKAMELQLDDEQFEILVADHFSLESEQIIQDLIRAAYDKGVVESRERLSILSKQGITMRKIMRKGDGSTDIREATFGQDDMLEIRELRDFSQDPLYWPTELLRELPPKPAKLRQTLLQIASRQVRINVSYSPQETEQQRQRASESIKPEVRVFKKGEKIIGDGEKIEPEHIAVFSALNQQAGPQDMANAHLGVALIAMLLIVVVQWFAQRSLHLYRAMATKDALFVTTTLILMLLVVRLVILIADSLQVRFEETSAEVLYYLAPFAAGAMLVRFILSAEASLVFTVIFSGLAGIASGNSLAITLYALVGSLVAANRVARANDRAALFKTGLWTGAANVLVVIFLSLISAKMGAGETMFAALCAFLSGALVVPFLVMGLTPLVEALFGYTTDIKLLELANLNHPALRELILQAPGTYHHSIIIGSLVEAAAEAIGANSLLARVCAYYHDIGKGKNPIYFAENQRGENKHNKLAPQMSALIVKRHVTDGMELARQYNLPAPVAAAIPQHHGTRLISFFYSKAIAEQEGKADPQTVDPSLYSYSGPKPQSRETALVMMGDVVEASSRAIPNPTPAKLQALIQTVIHGVFSEGQLDECDLTLRDLNEIGRAFFRVLGGIYHSRPEYPAQALSGDRTLVSDVKALPPQQGEAVASNPTPSSASAAQTTPLPAQGDATPATEPPAAREAKAAEARICETTTAKVSARLDWAD
ncbi:MAG: HDIG domain-containing protein [Myxococcales bacterium]|jgi:putative nucleotidyltransferase with HDIG domain|nr:HDIG domain-containing protein [Myxococcales bacterium]